MTTDRDSLSYLLGVFDVLKALPAGSPCAAIVVALADARVRQAVGPKDDGLPHVVYHDDKSHVPPDQAAGGRPAIPPFPRLHQGAD